jgi:hypothetical protein
VAKDKNKNEQPFEKKKKEKNKVEFPKKNVKI